MVPERKRPLPALRAFAAETIPRTVSGPPLTQNWMRDYDPTTGRYIQADPLGLVDGASVYGYALQNPGRYVDPTGLCPVCPVIPVIAGGSATSGGGSAIISGALGALSILTVGSMAGDTPDGKAAAEAGEGSQCEHDDDCPFEEFVRNLTRINDNDPRLSALSPHSLKGDGSEDLYYNRTGCVYVGPAKNARNPVGRDAVAYFTGVRI